MCWKRDKNATRWGATLLDQYLANLKKAFESVNLCRKTFALFSGPQLSNLKKVILFLTPTLTRSLQLQPDHQRGHQQDHDQHDHDGSTVIGVNGGHTEPVAGAVVVVTKWEEDRAMIPPLATVEWCVRVRPLIKGLVIQTDVQVSKGWIKMCGVTEGLGFGKCLGTVFAPCF